MDKGREAKIQNELYRLIKGIFESNNYVIAGLPYLDIEPEVHIEGGFADLVLYTRSKKPALVIECKRKVKGVATRSESKAFDPLSSKVIDQAMNYAVKLGAPLFATTDGKKIAIFQVPERGQGFRIDTNRVYISEIQLRTDALQKVIELVSKAYQGQTYTKTSLDWTFIIKIRSFVEYLSEVIYPVVNEKVKDETFLRQNFPNPEEVNAMALTRETAYIKTNQIIFYKILERKFPLQTLKNVDTASGVEFHNKLREYFMQATIVTNDFEPVFLTGVYDKIPLPDDYWALDEINNFIDDMGKYRLEDVGADVVGFIYETLIPDEERHKLGQFYTPPQIAELITRWAIKTGNEKVFDPSVGSGTFAVKSYQRLKELKIGQLSVNVHGTLLSQIFATDINSFPAHLTAMNLAMRDISHPVSDMNIIVTDFFNIRRNQTVVTPYMLRLPSGEVRRKVVIPNVDTIVGNPPYTRWTEIPDETRDSIDGVIGEVLKKYHMSAKGGVRSSQSPGIYIHFIIHASQFLNDGGKLGMIISNDWLQTEYGAQFQEYLLDNFRIVAVIDFSNRLFEIAVTATNVLLLEKCDDETERLDNVVSFAYVDSKTSIDKLLSAIESKKESVEGVRVHKIKQRNLPRKEKWTPFLFGAYDFLKLFKRSEKSIALNKVFAPAKGNITWTLHRASGLGAKEFFNLNKERAEYWRLDECILPTISSARAASTFVFTESDWKKLHEEQKDSYMFMCHKAKSECSEELASYIKWGETECYTVDKEKRKKLAAVSTASRERQENPDKYFGWYDLGELEVKPPYLFTIHNSWSKLRFMIAEYPVCLDHGFIVLRVKDGVALDTRKLKAMASFFNSSFVQLFAEANGRSRGQGALSLDLRPFDELRIPNPDKLTEAEIDRLAALFDRLNDESRKIGDISRSKNVVKLNDIYSAIDYAVAEIFSIPREQVEELVRTVGVLIERRQTRAEEPAPETLSGISPSRVSRPKKVKKKKEMPKVRNIFEFDGTAEEIETDRESET